MSPEQLDRLASIRTIDLTTYRRIGKPHRIEIWWFHIDGRFIVTGTPGPRDWLANVREDPRVVVHVDGVDHSGTAREVEDPDSRRRIFTDPQTAWYSTNARMEDLVATAPVIEITFDDRI